MSAVALAALASVANDPALADVQGLDLESVPPLSMSEYLTPPQAAALVPRRRRGQKCSVQTIYRWFGGCRGVALRYVQIGGTRCTTRAWMQEFFEALTTASRSGSASSATPPSNTGLAGRTTARRQRDLAKAEREAEALGV